MNIEYSTDGNPVGFDQTPSPASPGGGAALGQPAGKELEALQLSAFDVLPLHGQGKKRRVI